LEFGAIGCAYRDDALVDAVATQVLGLGFAPHDIHVGAAQLERAQAAAARTGVTGGVDPDDPLKGFIAAGREKNAREMMDRAGVLGGLLGAFAGCALSFTSAGMLVPVAEPERMLANIALYFVLGAIVGSVLGAALSPQPSTLVGFRLIDAMQEGALVLIVCAPRARLDELERVLVKAGGTGVTRA
jgi:uncharacterized membrane protein YeaQ/YmgE (transglycosylase-associated protein family)